MSKPKFKSKIVPVALLTMLAILFTEATNAPEAHAQAGIFEVIHPDDEHGQTEIEILSGIALNSI